MAVFRVHKSKDYTVMSNNHLRDKGLTLKAKGLMSLMLSLPDNWDYSIMGLVAISKDGKDSVMNTLTELESNGYLNRTRALNSKGQFEGFTYDIYEKPYSGKPYAENPNTGKPYAENPPQLNTKESSTKKVSTKESNTDREKRKRFIPPSVDEVRLYCSERNNGIDPQSFVDYYAARGWNIGKNKMQDWKAAVRTWENRRKADKPKQADPEDYGSPLDFYK